MAAVRVRYHTKEFSITDIHVRTLWDLQQFDDPLGTADALGIHSASWPLFGVVWASSEVLANHMSDFDIHNKRILEVGCGIGLASLMLNFRQANITATDYHPEAEGFLIINTALNHGKTIPFFRTGWAETESLLGKFDLIIGSDILYQPNHAELLSIFINQHASPTCEVILVDPGRSERAHFTQAMHMLGYQHTNSRPDTSLYLQEKFNGQILVYKR